MFYSIYYVVFKHSLVKAFVQYYSIVNTTWIIYLYKLLYTFLHVLKSDTNSFILMFSFSPNV